MVPENIIAGPRLAIDLNGGYLTRTGSKGSDIVQSGQALFGGLASMLFGYALFWIILA